MRAAEIKVRERKDRKTRRFYFFIPPNLGEWSYRKQFCFDTRKEAEAEAKKWRAKLRTYSTTITLTSEERIKYNDQTSLIENL